MARGVAHGVAEHLVGGLAPLERLGRGRVVGLWEFDPTEGRIVALTFVSVYEERRQVTTSEHSLAWALLDHLAGMIDVTGDPSAARQHLDSICRALQAAGMDVQVAPSDSLRDGPPPVAIRPFRLGKDDFTLRYIASPGRLEAATRRSVLMHLSVGMAALVPLVVGILLVLRLHLTKPLDRITHQLNRMRDGGVRFGAAGENLALAPTVQVAHDGLMNSPGHRANILNPRYRRVGIGVADGGMHGKMFVQNFAD